MIYSPSRGFVFIHVPRTGGFSIYRAVTANLIRLGDVTIAASPHGSGAPWWTHSRAYEVKQSLPHWESLWKWAVIRNPWDAVASSYRRIQDHAANLPDGDPPAGLESYWAYLRSSAALPFEEWIRRDLGYLQGGLWSYYCCGPTGEDLGVEAVRFDELPDHWPVLAERMGIPGSELPHVNAAAGEFDWTLAATDLAAELCRGDIERFGYRAPSL